jgi:hypothetical protein
MPPIDRTWESLINVIASPPSTSSGQAPGRSKLLKGVSWAMKGLLRRSIELLAMTG